MSLALFTIKPQYYKNGLFWYTKLLNKTVGEHRYDHMRVLKRIWSNKFYYARQQMLYELTVEHPDLAQWTGTYPKIDSSHGFPFYGIFLIKFTNFQATYEMYRDFQENTLNSDGSFAQWITLLCGIYVCHVMLTYMIPYYWNHTPLKNDEETRLRMSSAIAASVWEEIGGLDWSEWSWLPHDFAYNRHRGLKGYKQPDDIRAVHYTSFNRKNKYREHYLETVGEGGSMTF